MDGPGDTGRRSTDDRAVQTLMTTTMTRVSVVIPIHNRENLIAGAVRSVVEQKIPNLEILVIDDGSTDRSGEAARAADDRITVIRRARAGGPSAARNAGIAVAKGEWIAFLDSDDRWLTGSLEARLAAAERDAGTVLVSADASAWDGERVLSERLLGTPPIDPQSDPFPRLLAGNFVITSTVLARKEAVIAAGGFSEDLRYCEDYDLWLRLARLGRFGFVDKPAALYRVEASGLSGDRDAMFQSEIAILGALMEPGRGLSRLETETVEKRITDLHVERGYEDLIAGRSTSARRKLLVALRRHAATPSVFAYIAASFLPPPLVRLLRRARARPGREPGSAGPHTPVGQDRTGEAR
jgi:hypothetical protein